MKTFYQTNPPDQTFHKSHINGNATSVCQQNECQVVSDVRNLSVEECCSQATECDTSSDPYSDCGNSSGDDEIYEGLKMEIPGKEWVQRIKPDQGDFVNGPMTEAEIVDLLNAGTPIAREIHGHIMSLVGCKDDGTGSFSNVYRVLDSLEDPDDEIWLDFATLVSDDKEGGGRQDGPWGTAYW